ncbi:hypothetical protein E2553_19110 [Paraburkholderia dipogonis]|uniref:Uncharacterized protein n=1 Tax=Paraburkholderia dipogonis TaxID=1211383 RepID=A0A4Y8NB49_9BURK|nr:hypothetical protein [Paraburkholderia dipogonis]TFE46959.1 hypothetical protein E2553_19110 [Paraburkholderia dipogonis]
MTNIRKCTEVQRCGEDRALSEDATDVEESLMGSDSNGVRRDRVNWAWAESSAHYDWMDHAPLFEHRD